jgi:hypothetical protein
MKGGDLMSNHPSQQAFEIRLNQSLLALPQVNAGNQIINSLQELA